MKIGKLSANLAFLVIVLAIAVQVDLRNLIANKPAYGYGGSSFLFVGGRSVTSYAPSIVANEVAMAVNYDQEGRLTRRFGVDSRIDLRVSKASVESRTTFDVKKTGLRSFALRAYDEYGMQIDRLQKMMSIELTVSLPDDRSDLGVYYLDRQTGKWIKINNARFDVFNNRVSLETDRAADLMVANDRFFNARLYKDGELIRAADRKIFLINNGKKVQVRTLDELRRYHSGKQIHNVSPNILDLY